MCVTILKQTDKSVYSGSIDNRSRLRENGGKTFFSHAGINGGVK